MTKIAKIIVTTVTIFAVLYPYVSIAENADIGINFLKYYGYFKGTKNVEYFIDEKKVPVKEGEILRHEFNVFNDVEGVITDLMDVEVMVSNVGKKPMTDIEVTLSISPKIGYFVYIQDAPDEKIWGIKETERTAEWFVPIILTVNKIEKLNAESSTKVVFEKIELKKIINEYRKKDLWPTEFKFEISIEPQWPEVSFRNNTIFRLLKIPVPVY
jgi:hypothetical protein